MRDRMTITLTDVHGSRQYSVTHLFRMFFMWFLAGIAIIVLIGGGVLWQIISERTELESQIEDLYLQKEAVKASYQSELDEQIRLYSELELDKNALESEVQEKSGELNFLQGALGKIEDSFKMAAPISEKDQKMLDSLSPLDLEMLMHRVPSGLPTTFKMISDGYGWRTHPLTKKRTFHEGMDFSCDVGTPVFTTADGVVEYSGDSGDGYGTKVIVNHGFGFRSVYAHLSKASVTRGAVVSRRDEIGLSGKSGMSSGPHLHYEVHYLGKSINPRAFADWGIRKFDTVFKQVREIPWESFAELARLEKQLVLKQSLPKDVSSKEN